MSKLAKKYAGIYQNHKEGIVDLTQTCNHPLSFRYSEIFNAALINATPHLGRISPGWTLNHNAPFYEAVALLAFDDTYEEKLTKLKKSLSIFYEKFQPRNSLEWFNVSLKSSQLNVTPPWGSVLPWRARSSESYQTAITEAILKENLREGFSEGIESGWPMCGPMCSTKKAVEAKRLLDLVISIETRGYIRNNGPDGDIKATALIDKDEKSWKWLVTSGYHRACVLAALKYQSIPIRINNIIHVNHVHFWPHVQDGLYTAEEAEQVFFSIFEGRELN
ncbi:hypothetical protein [Vreelandella olivaria]|uniref:hypothetical protein n=1 Tax=Vreelandella olivaria TaxID=390919 RepID=UPI00201EA336|nr:hypothetical protein [Halomonas olivaria]